MTLHTGGSDLSHRISYWFLLPENRANSAPSIPGFHPSLPHAQVEDIFFPSEDLGGSLHSVEQPGSGKLPLLFLNRLMSYLCGFANPTVNIEQLPSARRWLLASHAMVC